MAENRFGSYVLVRRIAIGGMAELWEAKRVGPEGFEKTIAIKRILPTIHKQQIGRNLFTREARLVAELNHPNIVQVYDFGIIDDTFFIAMELVSGVDLSKMFSKQEEKQTKLPSSLAVYIALEVLKALQYAHDRNDNTGNPSPVIHRDISPSNILVSYDGKVKITDFGIAKALGADMEKSLPGVFMGKMHYASPEQLRGEPPDVTTDLFAVGILLYILLTNRRPFEGQTRKEILEKQLAEDYVSPVTLRSNLAEELARVIRRSLKPKREERYPSAADLIVPLERYLARNPWSDYSTRLSNYIKGLFEILPYDELPSQIATDPEVSIAMSDTTAEGRVVTSESHVGRRRPRRRRYVELLLFLSAALAATLYWATREVKTPAPMGTPLSAKTPSPVPAATPRVPTPTPTAFSTPPPRPTPGPTLKPPPPRPKKTAVIPSAFGSVTVFPEGPFAGVTVDGKYIGDTPILEYKLAVGKHEVVFENAKLGLKSRTTVIIEEKTDTKITKIWDAGAP